MTSAWTAATFTSPSWPRMPGSVAGFPGQVEIGMEHGVYPELLDYGEVQVLHLMRAKEGRAAIPGLGVAGCLRLQESHVPQDIDQVIRIAVGQPGRGVAGGDVPGGEGKAKDRQILAGEGMALPAEDLEDTQQARVLEAVLSRDVLRAFRGVAVLCPADRGIRQRQRRRALPRSLDHLRAELDHLPGAVQRPVRHVPEGAIRRLPARDREDGIPAGHVVGVTGKLAAVAALFLKGVPDSLGDELQQ